MRNVRQKVILITECGMKLVETCDSIAKLVRYYKQKNAAGIRECHNE